MGKYDKEPVEVDVEVVAQGGEAVLCKDGDGKEDWIPHSLIDEDSEIDKDSEPGEEGILIIPQWKAEEVGFV